MEEKNKPGETVPEPGESERISAERKAALQDIDRKREEKEKLRQTQKQEAVKVHGSLSAYMNWPLLVCISLLILSIIITMIDWMAGVAASREVEEEGPAEYEDNGAAATGLGALLKGFKLN